MSTVASTTPTESHCPACAFTFRGHRDRCPNCDRLLGDATARHMRRMMSFIFGLLMQIMVGLLVWFFPPGASAGSWVLYLALSVVGFVQILWGASGWRDRPAGRETPSITARFDPDDIPFHAKTCADCGHSLASAIESGARRCPSCGAHFSRRDLGWSGHDPRGEPVALPADETRVRGSLAVAAVVVGFVLIGLGFWVSLATAPSGAPPASAPPKATP